MDRRNFFKLTGTAGAALVAQAPAARAQAKEASPPVAETGSKDEKPFVGVLVDTTRCIGCRSCEIACANHNGLEVPDVAHDGALETVRNTAPGQYTVVNRFETDKGEVFVKKQCLHCWQPACTAACLTNAMYKTHEGPVIWRGNKCMGCRFCMVSCPFDMPKFEYDEWNPKIEKCTMCFDRQQEGKQPACVEACPTDALMFGPKPNLIEEARIRIYNHPTDYVHRVYGEYEVGGTSWFYLSAVPFEQIGFRTDLGTTPYPEYTKEFLYAVPVIFFGLPTLLVGLNALAEGAVAHREKGV